MKSAVAEPYIKVDIKPETKVDTKVDTGQWVEYAAPMAEVGTLKLLITENGVRELSICSDAEPGPVGFQHGVKGRDEVFGWLDRYFAGEQPEPLPSRLLDISGTEFEMSVWAELLRIPSGEVITYGTVAERIGKPGAARAVGTACGKNRLPILVPCHRVVASGGLSGGYSGGQGLSTKRALLRLEGVVLGR